ncbi:PVC-type heme-binding CxxCH protein [Neorhodopirellula pilleata]
MGEEASSKAPPLSPADSIATMKIADGYAVVPVLTEPHIHEPSAVAWDGNGRMYVIEMRTYMQDIDGKNQLAPSSRVSRHEDRDGDGVYETHTVFADNLILPRMVLPLLDRVIIRETNTLDLKSYQDTDDDGVADKIEMWHEGGKRGGNLEHQPSGLVWNLDNWIYTTYSQHRYRFTGGEVVREPLPHGSGQWGITHDDVGRIFYSTAGGENPAMDFQRPIIYGQLSLPGEQAEGFRECFPIDNVPDVQGGRARVRDDNTLNRFTGCCGQSIYRGNAMPADFSGDLIIPEPVGRLVRRAKVTNDQGRIVVSNAYDQSEFIAATDPNFRPVSSATGPDGCLYLVDMYRGIIQEGNWVRDGSYLRGVVQEYELDKNVGRGRIFRIDHETTQRGPQPRMLEESPAQLVAHLSHPNGWWRSEAQKLIVLHSDPSVVPALKQLAKISDNPLARLHALWTLEGLDAVDIAMLKDRITDSDDRVRSAAIRIAEPWMKDDRSVDELLTQAVPDESPEVAIQTLLSLSRTGHPNAESLSAEIVSRHHENEAVTRIADQLKARAAAMIAEAKKLEELRRRDKVLADSVVRGKTIYTTLCVTCHGPDGKGVTSPDHTGMMVAPSLVGSPRVTGHKERLSRIMLHGLMGPIDEKTYTAGLMLPMGANTDQWISDAANYIRNEWGNKAGLVESSDIARIREESTGRVGPWTLNELTYFDPPPLDNRERWKLTASHDADKVSAAVDGDAKSRWDTGKKQQPGMWFGIELPEPVKLLSITLDAARSKTDYPRGFAVVVSSDGKTWSEPVAKGNGDEPVTEIEIDSSDPVQHIRIEQTGTSSNKYWSIHELAIKGLSLRDGPPVSLSEQLSEVDASELAREARASGDALRGAKLFYNQSLSCAKCHDPSSGDRLGPDLASKRDDVNDPFIVESVLNPSKAIRKEFSQMMVLTADGLALTGFVVSESDDELVLREPAGGKIIKLLQDDIDAMKPSTTSAMPAGLINQLTDRGQFLDLIRFLMEVNDAGSQRLSEIKQAIAP